jgi:hypothetical protein
VGKGDIGSICRIGSFEVTVGIRDIDPYKNCDQEIDASEKTENNVEENKNKAKVIQSKKRSEEVTVF